jgi:hypothetical protein
MSNCQLADAGSINGIQERNKRQGTIMKLTSNKNILDGMRIFSPATLLLSCLVFTPVVFADEPAQPATNSGQAATRFGVVWHLKGKVTADANAAGKPRTLKEGSPVFVGDHVRAAESGEAAIKTDDGGVVAVRPGAEFTPESFAAEGKKSDHMILRLFVGSLRIITGWIGKLNQDEDRVVTPTSTIGVRGTDHEPYVLTADMAAGTQYKEGTYDKVNRGKTTLGEGEQTIEIGKGRVGFARQPTFEAKGLLTILMPVLLDKVPDFYVPGQFDTELDHYSLTADSNNRRLLAQKRKAMSACDPTLVARSWIRGFDDAVVRKDAPTIISLFAPEVAITANVRDAKGNMVTVNMGRDEMAKSTVAAMKGIRHYRQRRLTLNARTEEGGSDTACKRVGLNSQVIEQGVQSGKPYRFESTEDYVLEQRDGKWLAIKAETTQK